jgi:hypothetical protein
MMIKRLLKIYALLSLLTFVNLVGLKAQTHADATSQKWKGIDVSTVLGNSDYTDNGFPFLLYNVGTGRFIMQGGDWAMEGRLFFSDFGRQMYLHSSGRINSGITESQNADKNSFCVRPPEPFSKNWSDANYNTINLTTLMDGNEQKDKNTNEVYYSMNWSFERVEDASNTESYTYYMTQIYTKPNPDKIYYLGAAWGECHNTSVGKGDGKFVYLDDDRSCWTTVDVRDTIAIKAVPLWSTTTENGVYLKQENGKAMLENGDEVKIQKLYQWRLISVDEFIKVLNSNGMGLNPSISSLIKDRDFTRNANDFYGANNWTADSLAGHTYGPYNKTDKSTKRYTYTWGDYRKGQSNLFNNNQQSLGFVSEPWD